MSRKTVWGTKLFGNRRSDSCADGSAESIPASAMEPMKILLNSRGSVDILYKGKRAKFSGELGISGFRAVPGSMRWMEPERDAPVSEEEREEWMNAIINHPENNKVHIFFGADKNDDLKRAENYWNNKEYKKAGELFEKHADSLSNIQLKRLEYIKKHYTEKA